MQLSVEQEQALERLKDWWKTDSNSFVLSGYAGCFDKSTRVLTNRGLITLGNLIKKSSDSLDFKGFLPCREENLQVYTSKGNWQKVTQVFATDVTTGYRITTDTGLQVICSSIQPFMGDDGEWIKAEGLTVGDSIKTLGGIVVNSQTYFDVVTYVATVAYLKTLGDESIDTSLKQLMDNNYFNKQVYECLKSTSKEGVEELMSMSIVNPVIQSAVISRLKEMKEDVQGFLDTLDSSAAYSLSRAVNIT